MKVTQETRVRSLRWGDNLEKETATHSSILAWKIPGRGAWQATIHGVANSWTWLSTYAHTQAHAHTDDIQEVEQCLQQKLEGWGVGWVGRWGVGEETWIGRLQSPELNILELNPPATFLGAKCSGVLCCHIN